MYVVIARAYPNPGNLQYYPYRYIGASHQGDQISLITKNTRMFSHIQPIQFLPLSIGDSASQTIPVLTPARRRSNLPMQRTELCCSACMSSALSQRSSSDISGMPKPRIQGTCCSRRGLPCRTHSDQHHRAALSMSHFYICKDEAHTRATF